MNSRDLEASLGIGTNLPKPETVQEENQRVQAAESTRLLGQAFKADEVYQACKANLEKSLVFPAYSSSHIQIAKYVGGKRYSKTSGSAIPASMFKLFLHAWYTSSALNA